MSQVHDGLLRRAQTLPDRSSAGMTRAGERVPQVIQGTERDGVLIRGEFELYQGEVVRSTGTPRLHLLNLGPGFVLLTELALYWKAGNDTHRSTLLEDAVVAPGTSLTVLDARLLAALGVHGQTGPTLSRFAETPGDITFTVRGHSQWGELAVRVSATLSWSRPLRCFLLTF